MSIVERALDKVRQSNGAPATSREKAAGQRADPVEMPRSDHPPGAPRIAAGGPPLVLDLKHLCGVGLTYGPADDARKRNEYRAVRRQLLNALCGHPDGAAGRAGGLLVVTSAIVGEGKTYTSFNLARSIVEMNEQAVVLVDADLPRRTLSTACGAAERSGVAEYLRGDALSLESLTLPTSIPRLYLVPAGIDTSGSHDLMAGARLQALAANLQAIASGAIVIFDCPPALITDDAAQLVPYVDKVLVVVRAAKTLADVLRDALDRLDAGGKVVLILNAWVPVGRVDADYGGQYYGYTPGR